MEYKKIVKYSTNERNTIKRRKGPIKDSALSRHSFKVDDGDSAMLLEGPGSSFIEKEVGISKMVYKLSTIFEIDDYKDLV